MEKPSTLKLVQAVRSLQPTGGVSKVAFELAKEFHNRGLHVETITGELPLEKWAKIHIGKIQKINSIACLSKHLRGYWKINFTGILFPFLIYRSLLRQSIDCITLSYGDSFFGDIFVGQSCHNEVIHLKTSQGEWKWIFNPVHWFVLARNAWIFKKGHYRYVIAISKSIAEEFQNHHRVPLEKIRIIPNGVDTARFTPDNQTASRKRVFDELDLPDDTFLLLFAGHEFRRKGLGPLILALPDIKTDRRSVALIVLGQDNPAPFKKLAYEEGISDIVHFLGTRSDEEHFMAAADLFIFPTYYEPFGLVGIEALASGTPVLATKTGGISDYLEDTVNGLFIERDPKDIAEKTSYLLNHPEKLKKMGIAARKTAENYSWERIADQYMEIIEKVAQEKNAENTSC